MLCHFEEDPAKGIKPTVEVENPDADEPFKNILVSVKEKPNAKEQSNTLEGLWLLVMRDSENERQQYPHGLAEGAGQMGERGID